MSSRTIAYICVACGLVIYVSLFWASQAGVIPSNSWKMAGDIAGIYLGVAFWVSAVQYFKKSKFAIAGSLTVVGVMLAWSGWSAIL